MSTLLIRNGAVVTDLHTFGADVLVEDGRIREIAAELSANIIEADRMLLLPGGVDVRTGLEDGPALAL